MKNTIKVLAALSLLGVVSLPVTADITPPSRAEQPMILGAAAIYRDKTYTGYDDEEKWQFAPLIIWEGERFFFRGGTFGWKAWQNDAWEFAVIGQARGDGYDSDDADILEGMDDRDFSLDAGAQLSWKFEGWDFKATWINDVTSTHDGWEARGEFGYTHVSESGNWVIRPSGGLLYQSDDLVDYYYGVENDEVIPDVREAYSADSELVYRFQTVAMWNPGGSKWQLLFGGRFELQGDEFDNSPITDDEKFWMGFFGLGYRF